jgi:hypothetical protein
MLAPMTRVLLGALLGAGLLATVAYVWMRGADGCLGRCGTGTRCDDHRCVATADLRPAPGVAPKERRRRAHHGGANDPAAPPEVQLHPGDEKMVAQGDALGRPERMDLSKTDEPRELQQDDLDRVFRPSEPAILRCITDALGDAPLEGGKVEVGIRVEKSGQVSRVRVEGPALLQRQGLTRCVRSVVTALKFPTSGGSNVVTYPFELK